MDEGRKRSLLTGSLLHIPPDSVQKHRWLTCNCRQVAGVTGDFDGFPAQLSERRQGENYYLDT